MYAVIVTVAALFARMVLWYVIIAVCSFITTAAGPLAHTLLFLCVITTMYAVTMMAAGPFACTALFYVIITVYTFITTVAGPFAGHNCCALCHNGVGWPIHMGGPVVCHNFCVCCHKYSQSFITQRWQTLSDFSFLNGRNGWIVFDLCDGKLNIFGFWTAGRPKQNLWRPEFGLLETVNVKKCVFHYFLIIQLILSRNQNIKVFWDRAHHKSK